MSQKAEDTPKGNQSNSDKLIMTMIKNVERLLQRTSERLDEMGTKLDILGKSVFELTKAQTSKPQKDPLTEKLEKTTKLLVEDAVRKLEIREKNRK